MPPAASVAILAHEAAALRRPLAELARHVTRPSAGFIFVSGALASSVQNVAKTVRDAWPSVPTVIAAGAGVMTERGEHEGQSAAAAMLVSGGRAGAFAAHVGRPDDFANALVAAIGGACEGHPDAAVVFADRRVWSPAALRALASSPFAMPLFGGGTAVDPGVCVVDAAGRVQHGEVGGLVLHGSAPPRVAVSPAVKLIGPAQTVTAARKGLLLTLDDEPALDVLSRQSKPLTDRPRVLAIFLAPGSDAQLPRGVVRPVRGVDPTHKALLLGDEAKVGARVAFAVLDGSSSRANLDAAARSLAREVGGAAPRFGLYINCASRGRGLYGSNDVDVRILRDRFDKLAFAGMTSSFELAPTDAGNTVHLYSGAFGLFTAPS